MRDHFKLLFALFVLLVIAQAQVPDGNPNCTMPFCFECAQPSNCTSCWFGYFAVNSTTCSSCAVERCKICSGAGKCTECKSNRTLVGDICVLCELQNCESCSEANVCKTCLAGFTLGPGGKTCQQIQSNPNCTMLNCFSCPQPQSCTSCWFGYFPVGNTTCSSCAVERCRKCSAAGKCIECKSKRTLIGDLCVSCDVENCTTCSGNNFCSTCSNGLSPSAGGQKCLNCTIPNCAKCNNDKKCGKCLPGYSLFDVFIGGAGNTTGNSTVRVLDSVICTQCTVQNCDQCSADNVCGTCSKGYDKVGGSCVRCQHPCAKCSGLNKCQTCKTPFYFEAPTAAGVCIENLVPNCLTPDSSNTSLCKTCAQYFTLNSTSNTCVRGCAFPCLICSSNNTIECSLCQEGFALETNKTCKQCPRGCAQCSSSDKCSVCHTGFYNLNGQCKRCKGFCAACTSLNDCSSLDASISIGLSIIIINGEAVLAPCNPGCISCSPSNPHICVECEGGFFNKDGICKKCASVCRTCDEAVTTKCLTCFPNTFKNGDTCVQCNANCLTCEGATSPDKCLSCKDGAYLDLASNKCVQEGCPNNCVECSNQTACTKCKSGYTLYVDTDNGNQLICAQCISSCRVCAKGEPSTCVQCGDGFYLSGDTCIDCPANCKTCSPGAICTLCLDDYVLTQSGTCGAACQFPCSTCLTTDPQKCQSCIAGYTHDPITQSCVQILQCGGACAVCPLGYINSGGKCMKCTSSSCQSCDAANLGTCFGCMRGFYLDDSSVCKRCTTGCRRCISDTVCTRCASGYTTTSSLVIGSGFQCVACAGRCLTCRDNPRQCVTCLDRFKLDGWKCVRKFRFTINLVLNVGKRFFFGRFFRFLRAISRLMRSSSTDSVSLSSCKQGSTVVGLSADPEGDSGSAEAASQFSDLNNALISGADFAGMGVLSSSVGVSQGTAVSETKSQNLGLILGICIPIGILVLAAIILIIVKLSSKTTGQKYDDVKDDQGGESKEAIDNKNGI